MGPPARPSRRKLLATLGTAAIAPLSGCWCDGVSYDDRLRVAVDGIEQDGGDFDTRVRVTSVGPEQFDGPREEFHTTYSGVVLLAYDPDRARVTRTSLGDFPPGTVRDRTIRSAAFPLVLTAGAASVATEGDCSFAETGAEIRGYRGRFESDGSRGRTGHVWERIGERRLDDSLPPRSGLFESLKCEHRADVQVEYRPTPDLSLVPQVERWAGEPIPEPTIRHTFRFNAGGPASESDREQYYAPDRLVPFDRCPPAVRDRIEGVRYDHWIDREAFFDGVSALSGRRIEAPDELPRCERRFVVCHDDRGVKCGDGTARFGGALGKYVWYFTRYEETLYPVVACLREAWLNPDAPDELAQCSDDREESFELYVNHGLKHAHERRAVTIPPVVREVIREAEHGQNWASLSRQQWLEAVGTLQGRTDPDIPTCDWPNVTCTVDRTVHCGKGDRKVIFWGTVDGERWSIQASYDWRRLPE